MKKARIFVFGPGHELLTESTESANAASDVANADMIDLAEDYASYHAYTEFQSTVAKRGVEYDDSWLQHAKRSSLRYNGQSISQNISFTYFDTDNGIHQVMPMTIHIVRLNY